MCSPFDEVVIAARGTHLDSVVALLSRGLFLPGYSSKFLCLIGLFASTVLRKPRLYYNLSEINSTIGYVFVARKSNNTDLISYNRP